MDDLQIAWRPLGELIPYARNPRTHSDAQVAQIAASIREFGWTVPVLARISHSRKVVPEFGGQNGRDDQAAVLDTRLMVRGEFRASDRDRSGGLRCCRQDVQKAAARFR